MNGLRVRLGGFHFSAVTHKMKRGYNGEEKFSEAKLEELDLRELMPLPPEVLQAVASPGGGKIALVLGAGCSVEAPTNIPVSRLCSAEIYRHLVADGILQEGDCADPEDLSSLADAVFGKRNSQRDVVERLRDQYGLKLATPNDGYWIAAALLCEGTISSVVTLNYDLALSTALSGLGAGMRVGVVERPEDLPNQKAVNLYYLHRNANAADVESWVLRTAALDVEWKGHWESIIANKVLAAPVVLFAGLGTPVAVLIASTKLLRAALPAITKLYLADPGDMATSKFFEALGLDAAHYIPSGWGELMEALSNRLSEEQIAKLTQAAARKIREDHLPNEDITRLLRALQRMGIVAGGRLRAYWLLYEKPYRVFEENILGLLADLLLAIATIARVSGADAFLTEDGRVEFKRTGRTVSSFIVASGSGYRAKTAVETEVKKRRAKYFESPAAALVGGTSASWTTTPTPPQDIVEGDEPKDDILRGPSALPLYHIDELRNNHALIRQVVP